jgi:hypothetical protein
MAPFYPTRAFDAAPSLSEALGAGPNGTLC